MGKKKQEYEQIPKGFYLTNDNTRCYYVSGSTKGNKWIVLGHINSDGFKPIEDTQWNGLMWWCLLTDIDVGLDALNDTTFYTTNPTQYTI